MPSYFPGYDEVRSVALRGRLRNPHPNARPEILRKIDQPPADWEERTFLTVPGVVWTVSSDTCATGRLSAPDNVAYDEYFREFVFRQPRNETELAAIMSAESEEVFACYRFDGLRRWTPRSISAWAEDMNVAVGYARHVLATTTEGEVSDGLRQYEAYITSAEFADYLDSLERHLATRR